MRRDGVIVRLCSGQFFSVLRKTRLFVYAVNHTIQYCSLLAKDEKKFVNRVSRSFLTNAGA